MSDTKFRALVVEETGKNEFSRSIKERSLEDLPEGGLLVKVHYSSLNYKDALSATGNRGVTRKFPHTPGIDAAGEVVSSASGAFKPGEQVLVTSYDLGMNTPGGFGQYIRVPEDWAVKLPEGLSLFESMALGTAGLTAAICVHKLMAAGVRPANGDVLVTGATGGVGSIAVSILASEGYTVVASTGKHAEAGLLKSLGASEVITREDVLEGSERPMMRTRWAGVVDVVGGDTLAAALKATHYGGVVTCCGLVGSPELNVNVFPFIIRGVSLLGVDSVECPRPLREELWTKMAGPWKPAALDEAASTCTLEGLEEKIALILKGAIMGRTVVSLLD